MKLTTTRLLTILLIALSMCAGSSLAGDIDNLVSQLAGSDEVARSSARQMLAREGAAAFAKVLPLVSHENEAVWRAAVNVLTDIGHEVAVPGREAERKVLTEQLMTLVAPDSPEAIKKRGLRLLPLVVPDGVDVSPVAALLEDEALKEKARTCLESIGTREAGLALCDALSGDDSDFVAAVVNSLVKINVGFCFEAIRGLVESDDAGVRASALRALAQTGHPKLADSYWKLLERSTPETRFDTESAVLDYLENLADSGEASDEIAGHYERAITEFTLASTRGAALIGLAKTGGIPSLDKILEAANSDKSGDLDAPAIAAFESLEGEGVSDALTAAYPKVSETMRLKMLRLFGRSGDPKCGLFVANQLESEDSETRSVALRALGESDLLQPLVVGVRKTSEEERGEALEILLNAARRYESTGKGSLAGDAFLGLYELTDIEAIRNEALEGMARNPVPDAIDPLLEAISEGRLSQDATPTLIRLSRVLASQGKQEERRKVVEEIRKRANTTEAVRELLDIFKLEGSSEGLAESLGFVTSWKVVGPFPWDSSKGFSTFNVGEPEVDLTAEYEALGGRVGWKPHLTSDPMGTVDFQSVFGEFENVCAYAHAEIEVGEDLEAEVRAGSDDGIKIYVNRERKHANLANRGSDLDQDIVPIQLKKGKNEILVRITQGGGGWNFRLRLTKRDGSPVVFAE